MAARITDVLLGQAFSDADHRQATGDVAGVPPRFFLPFSAAGDQSEFYYLGLARHNHCATSGPRIWRLQWYSGGAAYECEVGRPLPQALAPEDEIVLAILGSATAFLVCTPKRGIMQSPPLRIVRSMQAMATCFAAAA